MEALLGWILALNSETAMIDVAPAQAQTTPEAVTRGEDLARRAVDCLIQGEDSATTAAQLDEYHRGLSLAEQAVAVDAQNADAQFALAANLGRVTLLESDPPNPLRLTRALHALDTALELDPHHPDALAARGGLYRQMPWWLGRDLHKAVDYLRQAVQLDPDNIGARIELALTYRDLGLPNQSIPLLEEAMVIAEKRRRPMKVVAALRLLSEISPANNYRYQATAPQ
ncbi:MAG TPA: hypothetical protein VMT89_16410 [Candidatus Acidoferrales bacterium]|nr:hypothetical protein [Candidatus Acidoferrales bacterium]